MSDATATGCSRTSTTGSRSTTTRCPAGGCGSSVATIVFSLGYWLYYQLGPGPTVDRAVRRRDARGRRAPGRARAAAGRRRREDSLRALARDAARHGGGARRSSRPAACPATGPQGQGISGPTSPTTTGSTAARSSRSGSTITEGVPGKGMVPWKDQLKPDEISALAAYVSTLAGTNPPNPKPPQGVNARARPRPDGAGRSTRRSSRMTAPHGLPARGRGARAARRSTPTARGAGSARGSSPGRFFRRRRARRLGADRAVHR